MGAAAAAPGAGRGAATVYKELVARNQLEVQSADPQGLRKD